MATDASKPTIESLRRTLIVWEGVLTDNIERFEQRGDPKSIMSAHLADARRDTVREVLKLMGRGSPTGRINPDPLPMQNVPDSPAAGLERAHAAGTPTNDQQDEDASPTG